MNKKRECENEITPCSSAPHAGMANPNTELARRAELNKLTSTVLSKLLSLKNVPGRSKLKRKAEKLNALEGMITISDIKYFKVNSICPRKLSTSKNK